MSLSAFSSALSRRCSAVRTRPFDKGAEALPYLPLGSAKGSSRRPRRHRGAPAAGSHGAAVERNPLRDHDRHLPPGQPDHPAQRTAPTSTRGPANPPPSPPRQTRRRLQPRRQPRSQRRHTSRARKRALGGSHRERVRESSARTPRRPRDPQLSWLSEPSAASSTAIVAATLTDDAGDRPHSLDHSRPHDHSPTDG